MLQRRLRSAAADEADPFVEGASRTVASRAACYVDGVTLIRTPDDDDRDRTARAARRGSLEWLWLTLTVLISLGLLELGLRLIAPKMTPAYPRAGVGEAIDP
jgi:hypothetical protein